MAPALASRTMKGAQLRAQAPRATRSTRSVVVAAAKPVEQFKTAAVTVGLAAVLSLGAPMVAKADYGTYYKADSVPEACKKICATQPTACVSCIKSNS